MKVKFGALMVDARGKAGGTVFSKNKSGAYAKNKVTPTNPQTSSQMAVRGKLAVFARQWRSLSDAVRAEWAGLTDAYSKKNVFGDSYTLAPNMLFNSLNLNLNKIGRPPITTPLAPVGTQNVTLIQVNALDIATVQLEISTAMDSDNLAIVCATPSLSAGIKNFKTKLRQIAIVNTASGTAVDVFNQYVPKFGTPIAGSRIGFSFVVVNRATGESSAPQFIDAIVN